VQRRFSLLFWMLLVVTAVLSACDGCRPTGTTTPTNGNADAGRPDLRLFFVSDLAGAIEPCGCVKDQLGGMDHFAALVAKEKAGAGASAVLAVGPTHFMDAAIAPDRKNQETKKAVAIAQCLEAAGLTYWVPGKNDWVNGQTLWKDLNGERALSGKTGFIEGGGLKVGIVGVTAQIEGLSSKAPADVVKERIEEAKKGGANAIVVLAAVGRGEAKRIADVNPDVLAIVVASAEAKGEESVKSSPAERIGETLVIQTANHLQTVATLDLFSGGGARGEKKPGLITVADGSGIDRIKKREELSSRINELRERIATWETDKSVDAKDIAARKADMQKLEAEREAIDKAPAPAVTGAFYRYAMHEIRDKLGADDKVKAKMLAYYKQVNDENKETFKDKKPPAPAKGEPKYIGIEACTNCHEEPKKVWDATKHAKAYETLSSQFKEYNLDCVSCHVTGYDKAGGSTVTHVAELKNVQCEVCHGPGENHAKAPEKVRVPIVKPSADSCLSCHHPPHVHTFDAKAKMADILGPGHGEKKK
jgi:hypothetical protein